MVSTDTETTRSPASVELARHSLDHPQPVTVRMHGFDYPGEVIFADVWQPWFGDHLPDRVMFRFVLLSEHQRVDPSDIRQPFIAVAVPSPEITARGETEYSQLYREIGRLNEIRERYVVSSDNELCALTSQLSGHTSNAQRDIASVLGAKWRRGNIITASRFDHSTLSADSVFIGDDSAAWVEAISAGMFSANAESASSRVSAEKSQNLTAVDFSNLPDWMVDLDANLRIASGSKLEPEIKAIDRLRDTERATASGNQVRHLLVRELGLPPALASTVVAAYIHVKQGEAGLVSSERLDRHSIHAPDVDGELIYLLDWLDSDHSNDWNSALPYLRVLFPHARPSRSPDPDDGEAERFLQALQIAESRTTLTLRTLEAVLGPGSKDTAPLKDMDQLARVLRTPGWRDFYIAVRGEFPSVREFAAAMADSARLRTLSEDMVDVKAAHDYVSAADFGRLDQALASEAVLLAARLDVASLVESRGSAASELQEFQKWKQQFRRAYLEHHASRRSSDLELQRRVKEADSQLAAVRSFSTIPELAGIYDPAFARHWEELKERVEPCSRSEHQVELQLQPHCTECGVRLGSAGSDDEANELIASIEEMLRESGINLSKIATGRVLTGKREDELRKLIDMNALSNLTSIRNVLDDDVLDFLRRFASDDPGPTDLE